MRAIGLMCAAVLLLPLGADQAQAQPVLEATLESASSWLAPEDTLRLRLKVANSGDAPADDLRVSIAIHEAVETRSHLAASFEGALGTTIAGDTVLVDEEIPPGSTESITVDKPLGEISFFRFSAESRAYPLRITVLSGFERAAPIDSHMVLFRSEAEAPLRLLLVVPLENPVPPYAPDGLSISSSGHLDILATLDRLESILGAIEDYPDVPVTLAPSGLLLTLLDDLSDGYRLDSNGDAGGGREVDADSETPQRARDVLELLTDLAGRPEVTLMTSTYSGAFLPRLPALRAQAQVSSTEEVLEDLLEQRVLDNWFLPSPPVVDEAVLNTMANSGVRAMVLQRPGLALPPSVLTPAAPVEVTTRAGRQVDVIVADEGLGDLMVPAPEVQGVVARQRILADTAAIMLERPATSRIAAVVTPTEAGIEPVVLSGLLRAMQRAPWLTGTSPAEALEEVESAGPATLVPLEEVDPEVLTIPEGPVPEVAEAVDDAREAIEMFADIEGSPQILAQLESRLLMSESAAWWTGDLIDEARSFALGISASVRGEFDKFQAPQPQTITLTSRTATIPLTVTSQADYPAEMVIRLDSDKLSFPDSEPCPGAPEASCVQVRLQPLTQTIPVATIADDSGTFPLRVSLLTPNSGFTINSSRLAIRSTAYNLLAVAITIGAGVFLFGWWTVGAVRRRLPRS